MSVNKVIYGGATLLDLTGDTVDANKLLSGATAHNAAGNPITGTIQSKTKATIIPGTADQTIAAGQYLSGEQIIKGDPNLRPENIAKGVTIFGVTGTLDNAATIYRYVE